MNGSRRIASFIFVGAAGFAVDAGVLLMLAPILGAYAARFVSFSVAVTATWILNRILTFSDRRSRRKAAEWARYASTQSIGALANLAIYAGALAAVPALSGMLIVPLAFGSAGGLIINYCLAHWLAFPVGNQE